MSVLAKPHRASARKIVLRTGLLLAAFKLAGCATPNGGGITLSQDENNADFCPNIITMEQRVESLAEGTDKQTVLETLAGSKNAGRVVAFDSSLQRLDREGIFDTLYPSSARLEGDIEDMEQSREFLGALKGLELECVDTIKRGGLRLTGTQTHTTGFDYSVRVIFNNDNELVEAIIDGGKLNRKNRNSYFNYTVSAAKQGLN